MEEKTVNTPVANNDQDRMVQLVNRVFDLDLLLDMILDYVVHDEGEDGLWNIKCCRLVNKGWLRSINRIHRKCKIPLFVFNMFEEPSNDELPFLTGKVPCHFVRSVTENVHLDEHVTPYAIITRGQHDQTWTFRLVFNCLINCGNGLIQLDLRISGIQPPFQLNNNFSFPRLSRFTVRLHSGFKSPEEISKNMEDKIGFIQSVLDASERLQSFTLDSHDEVVPKNFCNLLLPSSIKHLDFNSSLSEYKLQQPLLNSSLPKLTTLKLLVSHSSPFKDGLITSILEKFKKTLQNFQVKYTDRVWKLKRWTTFQLPIMEKLETLYINTPSFELEGNPSYLHKLVPMLNEVTLCRQTASMFRKWTYKSCFSSVTYLSVSIFVDAEGLSSWDFSGNIDLTTMQALHVTFPNLQELDIVQTETNMATLIFIMREMQKLRSLRIRYHTVDEWECADIWDSALIGIPPESVGALRQSPDLWEGLQAGNSVSLRSLTELNTLVLYSSKANLSRISEMAFQYAFLRMPKLRNLYLRGGFWTTREMTSTWQQGGRTIEADIHEGNRDSDDD